MRKLIIFSIFLLFVDAALACSCMGSPKEKQLEYADVVFLGIAKNSGSITTTEKIGPREYTGTKNETSFSVEEVFKGQLKPSFKIYSEEDSAACGVNFKEGKTYIVFAYYTEEGRHPSPQPVGELATDSCTMTFEVEKDRSRLNTQESDLIDFLRSGVNKHNQAQKEDANKDSAS
ncbi:MAG: hypothetical protein HWE13_06415 [Gammaproteobacteria bacterium]|nr:hypothetical protein [Gammaproteobacteria bacterium]